MMPFPFIAAGVAVGTVGTVAGAVGGTAYLVTQDGEGKIQKSPEERYEIPKPNLGKGFTCTEENPTNPSGYPSYQKTYTCKYINPKLANSKEDDETKAPDPTFPVKKEYNPNTQKVTTTVYDPNGSVTAYRSDPRNSGYTESRVKQL